MRTRNNRIRNIISHVAVLIKQGKKKKKERKKERREPRVVHVAVL